MIPIRLHLTDFLSYKTMPEPLDFSQVRLACLSGPNGHGKSALLDAMTWALWGKARGCEGGQEQERLIRDGADAMRVEFVFELDGQTYRVARSRWRTGKADIAFNVLAPDGSWTDLAGEGIADTQRRVIERLRMDYETFVASAFILQGRADTFTRLDPRQRKDVLAQDPRARDLRAARRPREGEAQRRADRRRVSATLLAALERDLAARPDLEARTGGGSKRRTTGRGRGARRRREILAALRINEGELRSVEAAATEAAKRLEEASTTLTHDEDEILRLADEATRLEAESRIDPAAAAAQQRPRSSSATSGRDGRGARRRPMSWPAKPRPRDHASSRRKPGSKPRPPVARANRGRARNESSPPSRRREAPRTCPGRDRRTRPDRRRTRDPPRPPRGDP